MAIDMSRNHTVFDSVNMASTKYAERIFDFVCRKLEFAKLIYAIET